MPRPDLNLLVTLDVLLAEGSVARAAQRLRLSPSAMSRALARLRDDDRRSAAGPGRARPRSDAARARAARAGRSAGAGRRSGAAPGGDARPRTARPHLHAAHQRRLRRELRTAPDRARRHGGARRAAALRAEARQGQHAAARRQRRSGDRRGRDRRPARRCARRRCSRDRFVGVVRHESSARPGQGHARPLCGRPAHPGVTARPRHGTDRRGA